MNEKLKKCPFCGGEVDFWTRTEAEDYQALIIDCKDCPANMEEWVYKYDKNFAKNFEKKKAEVIEAWNRRVVTDTNDGSKERTAKVECIAEVYRGETVPDHYLSGMCGMCCETAYDHAKYCSECGAKLDWSGNERFD